MTRSTVFLIALTKALNRRVSHDSFTLADLLRMQGQTSPISPYHNNSYSVGTETGCTNIVNLVHPRKLQNSQYARFDSVRSCPNSRFRVAIAPALFKRLALLLFQFATL
jgi:hypothetical protein